GLRGGQVVLLAAFATVTNAVALGLSLHAHIADHSAVDPIEGAIVCGLLLGSTKGGMGRRSRRTGWSCSEAVLLLLLMILEGMLLGGIVEGCLELRVVGSGGESAVVIITVVLVGVLNDAHSVS